MGRTINARPTIDAFGRPEPGTGRAALRDDWNKHLAAVAASPDHDSRYCPTCRDVARRYAKAAR